MSMRINSFFKYNLVFLVLIYSCKPEEPIPFIIETDDVERYWSAYDQIIATDDSTQQYEILQKVFLEPASAGQLAMMDRRNYRAEEYLTNIEQLPKFWSSVRDNTLKASNYADRIEAGIEKLREVYPELKPAEIYFTMGCLRSNGTTLDSLVLIGAELAMTDSNTDLSELPERARQSLQPFIVGNPIHDLVLLNVHEYVHTQQSNHGIDLLSQCVYEGVAEFVSVKVLDTISSAPAIDFGLKNDDQIQAAFINQMNSTYFMDWLYNDFNNEFAMRDLGYYVGFAIAENVYNQATDKKSAIAEMIELDYRDPSEIDAFVDRSGYFTQPINELRKVAANMTPQVVALGEIVNGDTIVANNIAELEIQFSMPMDTLTRGFDFGPGGESTALFIQSLKGWNTSGDVLSVGISLEPGRHYQLVLSNDFRSAVGVRLEPFLIDFYTAN